jgi:hypothetical protein
MSDQGTSEAGGFFSRWSQRKQAVKQGAPLAEPLKAAPEPQRAQAPQEIQVGAAPLPLHTAAPSSSAPPEEPVKPLTLEDVAQLTPESDFTSYMTTGVSPEVRNAAMKKLLADPHYNIMDGLDIYIGDYNTPDPLPEGMLAKMVGAQFLGLVKAPEDVAQSGANTSDSPAPPDAALSAPAGNIAPLEIDPVQHDHTHLRLQSDDAPAAPEAGPSAG